MRIKRLQDGDFLVHIDCDLRSIADRRMFVSVDKNGMPMHPELMPTIVKMGRAHKMVEMLASGTYATMKDMAECLDMSSSTIGRIVPAAFLSPEIVHRLIAGKLPSAKVHQLIEKVSAMPLWSDQHAFLGID